MSVVVRHGERVWVVQADTALLADVVDALREEGYEAQGDADGREIDHVLEAFRPDFAILDVHLGEGPDGYAIGRRLRAETDTPFVFLTAAGSLPERLRGFDAGADDYIVKPFWLKELLARVRVALRRSARAAAPRRLGDLELDERSRTAKRAGKDLKLTKTEYQLLSVLAQHSGTVLSRVQLLTQVWGFDAYDTNVIEVHISALRRKTEVYGPRLVHTVRGAGYVLRP